MDLSLLQDKTQLIKLHPGLGYVPSDEGDRCPVRSIECFQDAQPVIQDIPQAWMVQPRPDGFLRILYAPPDSGYVVGMTTLLRHLQIPDAFVLESNKTPCSSFGYRIMPDGGAAYWFHLLFKTIEIDEAGQVINRRHHLRKTGHFSQSDDSWTKSAFFLRWYPALKTKHLDNHSSTQEPGMAYQVDFCCFGAPKPLESRLTAMCFAFDLTSIRQDPFILFNIVLEELFKTLNRPIINLKYIILKLENESLLLANRQKPELQQYDFVGLYNVTKHVVHLKESSDAIIQTCQAIQRAHSRFASTKGVLWKVDDLCLAIEGELDHKASLLGSHSLRVGSMDRRMSSLTNLAFNMINQRTGLIAIEDSTSMRMIGILTLIFLPFASIAALFSTPFFSAVERPDRIYVARDFWLFWAIVIPLTLFLLITATLANALSMKRRGGERTSDWPRELLRAPLTALRSMSTKSKSK